MPAKGLLQGVVSEEVTTLLKIQTLSNSPIFKSMTNEADMHRGECRDL